MISFAEKQIIIDGQPIFLLSGELHYFRQPKDNWQHLIEEAKQLGLNCIASYIPWILHEEEEGEYDFSDHLDLSAFLQMVKEAGLYFFLRPGPFIMAEMKNEGLPYWIAKKHPEAVPVGFDGERKPSTTLDYLHEGYLSECKKWYQKIFSIIKPYLHTNGGPIIGVQLDNEVGMLNWVTNTPVLNDNVLNRFVGWLKENYNEDEISIRYGFELNNNNYAQFRSPKENYSVAFHFDFGKFLRKYYKEYILTLREYALECGITDIPFFINIHGTGERRIFDFPLGISQLSESYNAYDDMISGTDVYLGEPVDGTYQDMYVINALTDSMNKRGNPLTSIEFECSDGPYCSLNGMRYHPSATSHKMLLCLSQNARMLNFYVFSGGENYLLRHQEMDGNGRMAFTGQLHGMNAPVQPDGTRNFSFEHIAKTAKTIHALNHIIGSSYQVTDDVVLGFIPDYFLTELSYGPSKSIEIIHQNLKKFRCATQIDYITRALLGSHIHFTGRDLSEDEIDKEKVLVVLSARYMAKEIQEKLVDYVEHGGRLLLFGEVPEYDMEGKKCKVLLQALNLSVPKYKESVHPVQYLTAENIYGTPGQRVTMAQCFEKDSSSIVTLYQRGEMCGFIKEIGQGKICGITCDYPADMDFFGHILRELSIHPAIEAEYYIQGIYLSCSRDKEGQELLYVINLDAVEKTIDIVIDGEMVFPQFVLKEKASHILPLRLKYKGTEILNCTGEVIQMDEKGITFKPVGAVMTMNFSGEGKPASDKNFKWIKGDKSTLIFNSKQEQIQVTFTF